MTKTNLLPDNRKEPNRTVFIKSYGCQMNVYDSDRMVDSLVADGFVATDTPDKASLVILNTCHIREKAAEKIYSELGKLKQLKKQRTDAGDALTIAVAGCVAQAEGAEIVRRQPAVDIVVGPQSYHRLGDLLRRSDEGGAQIDTDFPVESKFDYLRAPSPENLKKRGYSAFVTVQEGCDKFCTFCVVPYTRGVEVSRPVEDILDEIKTLALGDVREVTLIGQNVNAYHGEDHAGRTRSLAYLIEKIAEMAAVKRVRYTTSHPRDMADDLIAAHGSCPKLMPYLHLPVQSGSDRILNEMNRKHTADDYKRIMEKVRKVRPDIALSSDFIVGFPGETDQDFLDTLRLVEETEFACAYSFKYSSRPGTSGAQLEDDVSEQVKSARLKELQILLEKQKQDFNRKCVGSVVPVLFEKAGRHPGQVVGKTPYLQSIQIDGPNDLKGQIAPVLISRAGSNSLFGSLALD